MATTRRYSVTITNTNTFDGPPNPRVREFASGGEAVAWLLDDFLDEDYGFLDARMAQQAEEAEWRFRGWRGEPVKVLGYLYAAYVLPEGDTWEAFEARVAAERQRSHDHQVVDHIARAARDADRAGKARIVDPEAFAARVVALGHGVNVGREVVDMVAALERTNAEDLTDVEPVDYALRALAQGWRLRDLELSLNRIRLSEVARRP